MCECAAVALLASRSISFKSVVCAFPSNSMSAVLFSGHVAQSAVDLSPAVTSVSSSLPSTSLQQASIGAGGGTGQQGYFGEADTTGQQESLAAAGNTNTAGNISFAATSALLASRDAAFSIVAANQSPAACRASLAGNPENSHFDSGSPLMQLGHTPSQPSDHSSSSEAAGGTLLVSRGSNSHTTNSIEPRLGPVEAELVAMVD